MKANITITQAEAEKKLCEYLHKELDAAMPAIDLYSVTITQPDLLSMPHAIWLSFYKIRLIKMLREFSEDARSCPDKFCRSKHVPSDGDPAIPISQAACGLADAKAWVEAYCAKQ